MKYGLDTREMASALFEMCADMEEIYLEADEKESIIKDLDEALYHIKVIAENDLNPDYWRTFYKCLETVSQ